MPATRVKLGANVFEKAIERLAVLYAEGHRLVISFSGGKDSGVMLEIAILAARMTNRLPVDVIMREEEIMIPGTYEYADWVANRPEVSFTHVVAHQPIINVYNRHEPYFWVMDPLLTPEQWVRKPPPYAIDIPELNIDSMTIPSRFPPQAGANLYAVVGLRVQESRARMFGLFRSRGHITIANRHGVQNVRPIYDMTDSDIWRAIRENGWRYNTAYDMLLRMGIPPRALRIAPPTMNHYGADILKLSSQVWPGWFDRVCDRLPGVRQVALFGNKAIIPHKRGGETWEETFKRVCLGPDNPAWIIERAARYSNDILTAHRNHATFPLPDVEPCYVCQKNNGSWRSLTRGLYSGDPFGHRTDLPAIDPDFFRPGSGFWEGRPNF
jgi:predicted phosphoadenosine phosphosulfate sulfurtransferase